MAARWLALRKSEFRESKLVADIEEFASLLKEAQVRNFSRWDVLGSYVRYNPSGWRERSTYDAEVEWLKSWLRRRLRWLDAAIAREFDEPDASLDVRGVPR